MQKKYTKLSTVAIGKTAPDFALADTNNNKVSLSSFRGKYVLLDFWASWCPLCRQANPGLIKTYNQYKNRNFTVLGVSLDKQGARETWLKAIHNDNLTLDANIRVKILAKAVLYEFISSHRIAAKNFPDDLESRGQKLLPGNWTVRSCPG